MYPPEGFKYDKAQFFEALKAIQKYQVGNKHYFLNSGKLTEGTIYEVNFKVYDHGMDHTCENRLTVNLNVILMYGASKVNVPIEKLFETREEAADQFLKDNDVPAELLKVLKVEKPKTTVGDLIEKLQRLPLNADLGDKFNLLLNTTMNIAVFGQDDNYETTTDKFWDCECLNKYVHHWSEAYCPDCKKSREEQPDSRVSEVTPENFYCLK